jgi:hypothetical protein
MSIPPGLFPFDKPGIYVLVFKTLEVAERERARYRDRAKTFDYVQEIRPYRLVLKHGIDMRFYGEAQVDLVRGLRIDGFFYAGGNAAIHAFLESCIR